jgi:hypothetical protein
MTEAEALVPAPRELAMPQYEDANGDKHFDVQEAWDANRRIILTQIVERDFEVNGNPFEIGEEDVVALIVVALIERNAGALHVALNLELKKGTIEQAFAQFMTRKFGKDWRERMTSDDSIALVAGMRDAYVAGAEAL